MTIENVTIGSDPELFLIDSSGNAVSSEGLIGGDKESPRQLSDKGHAVQEDNVMVEFNIPPVIDEDSFVRELDFCLSEIDKLTEYDLDIVSSKEFSKEQLSTPQAEMFGCSPDFTVWNGSMNDTPTPPEFLRFAGGHIHVGFDEPDIRTCDELVKALDLFLGVPAVIMDDDTRRKEFYGSAGRFRDTSYGVEYRTLSNFWLKSEELQRWAFQQVLKAINYVNSNKEMDEKLCEDIQEAINTNNTILAESIISKENVGIIKRETNEEISAVLCQLDE